MATEAPTFDMSVCEHLPTRFLTNRSSTMVFQLRILPGLRLLGLLRSGILVDGASVACCCFLDKPRGLVLSLCL